MRALCSHSVLLLVASFIVASGLGGQAVGTSNDVSSFGPRTFLALRTRGDERRASGAVPQPALRLSGGGKQRGGPYALRQKNDAVLKKIIGAESVGGLLKIVQVSKLGVDSVGASFYVLAQLCEEGGVSKADVKAAVAVLSDEADRRVLTLDGKAISSILWSLATISGGLKLGVPVNGRLVKSLATRAVTAGLTKDFTSLEVANVLWALSRLELRVEKPVLDAVMARVASTAEQFNPKSIAHVLWAMATLKVKPPSKLVEALCKRGKQLAYAFDDEDVKEAVWAVKHLDIDAAARAGLTAALEKRGAALTTDSIAAAMKKLAGMGVKADTSASHPAFVPAPKPMGRNPIEQLFGSLAGAVSSVSKKLQGMGEKLQDPETLQAASAGLQPARMAASLREAVEAGSKAHAAAVEQLAAKGRAMAGEFKAAEVVETLQALAAASLGAGGGAQLVEALSRRGKAIVTDFDAGQVSAAVAALASMKGQEGKELLEALAKRGKAIASEFNAKEVADTLEALAASGEWKGGQLLEAMGARGKELVGEFSPGELARAMEALAGVAGSKEAAALMAALAKRGEEVARKLSSADAASMLAAMAARGEQDSRALWEAVATQAEALAQEFRPEDLSKALAAISAAKDRAASELAQALLARGRVLAPTLDAQQVVEALASLAEMATQCEGAKRLAEAVSARAKALAGSLSAQELANIMAVLERLGASADPELVRLLRERANALAARASLSARLD